MRLQTQPTESQEGQLANRQQLLNDNEEAMRIVLESLQVGLWTAMPCIVQSVDLSAMTCTAQPTIMGTLTDQNGVSTPVNYPLLLDVPIVFPSAGGFLITFPMVKGDEVLVVFASRCIDAWWQSGGIGNLAMEARMHDLSDGFAIPGPRSQPNTVSSISATDLQIRNDAGTTFLSITAAGKIGFANVTTDLKTILTDLQSVLLTFMGVLNAFTGTTAPTTQAMLQAPASAAVTALGPILVKIGTLLQ